MGTVTLGSTITIHVSLITPDPPTPTGVIVVQDNGATILVQPLISGAAVITLDTTDLGLGVHDIIAYYAGDANYSAAVSNTLVETIVNPTTTTSVVTTNTSSITFGDSVTITFTVTAGAMISAGTVQLTVNGVNFGSPMSVTPTSTGCKTITTTTGLTIGSDSIGGVYSGGSSFGPSTATGVVVTVGKVTPTNVLISSGNPSVFNTNVTFTSTVAGGAGTPAGNVIFKDGTLTLATVALSSGVATYTLSGLSGGSHSITAVYQGNATYTTRTSNTVTQLVNAATTSLVIESDSGIACVDDIIRFIGTITSDGGTADGFIQFLDGGSPLGSPTVLEDGIATLFIGLATSGTHTITATYTGSSNYSSTTSVSSITEVIYSPLDDSDIYAWWRSDLGTTLSGNTITQWLDQTGDASHALTQFEAEDVPIYNTSDSDFNGYPSLGTTPGVDEVRALASTTFTSELDTPATWYHVFNAPHPSSAHNVYLRLNTSGSESDTHDLVLTSSNTAITTGDGGGSVGTTITPGTTYIAVSVHDGAGNVNLYLNSFGTSVTGTVTNDPCQTLFTGTFTMENSRYKQAEIIAFNTAHDSSRIQTVIQNLAFRYDIILS